MDRQNNDIGRILEAIEQLRSDVSQLQSRVAQLEGEPAQPKAAQPPAEPAPPVPMDAETMMAVAAAVAAYLGKKPRIRSIRLLRSDAWAQEGRATLQAWHGNRPSKRA